MPQAWQGRWQASRSSQAAAPRSFKVERQIAIEPVCLNWAPVKKKCCSRQPPGDALTAPDLRWLLGYTQSNFDCHDAGHATPRTTDSSMSVALSPTSVIPASRPTVAAWRPTVRCGSVNILCCNSAPLLRRRHRPSSNMPQVLEGCEDDSQVHLRRCASAPRLRRSAGVTFVGAPEVGNKDHASPAKATKRFPADPAIVVEMIEALARRIATRLEQAAEMPKDTTAKAAAMGRPDQALPIPWVVATKCLSSIKSSCLPQQRAGGEDGREAR